MCRASAAPSSTMECVWHAALRPLRDGWRAGPGASVLVATGSMYGIDSTVTSLRTILDAMHEVFPAGNAQFVVDEAHATRLYGCGGRRVVPVLELEDRVHTWLHVWQGERRRVVLRLPLAHFASLIERHISSLSSTLHHFFGFPRISAPFQDSSQHRRCQ